MIRLNKEHEDFFIKESNSGNQLARPQLQLIQEQVSYATKNLRAIDAATAKTEGAPRKFWKKDDAWNLFFYLAFECVKLYCIYYISIMFWKALTQSQLSNHKIDIKIARDIEQRLSDVKGCDEIKEEIENVIKMLKDPERYREKGCKLHKGIMLYGEPGTGKTLIARAIAGESGCNFIFTSGADFDEMYVGVGAARVRQLFKEARKQQPCIIFIDEIDSLISETRRMAGEGSSSRATINQLLSEMDGFSKNDNICVMGATNHESTLDPAATRPGRFDKKIHVPRPDINGR